MAVVQGNEKEFHSLTKDGIVIVDFFATWCGPCKMMSPILEEVSNDRADLKIVKIDVDENEDLARKYGVMSIPTLLLMKDGEVLSKQVGFLPKDALTSWIEENQ